MNISQHANRIAVAAGLVALTMGAPGPAVASLPPNIVYSTADSGPGSLRYAIENTWVGGAVYFALEANSIITLTSGPLVINKDVTIAGQTYFGSPIQNVTLSGNDAGRVISITAPVSVTLNGLTITRGRIVGSCDDPGVSEKGGGIYAAGGVLTILNSTIAGNRATCPTLQGLWQAGSGGGVYSEGTVIIRDSRIEDNQAPQFFSGNIGGVSAGQQLVLVNSTVSNNVGTAGAISAGSGVTIERSTIISNTGYGVGASGGSIVATTIMSNTSWGVFAGGQVTVTDSTLSANRGGGIYNTGRLALVNSTLSGNGGAPDSFGALQQSGAGPSAFIASSTIVNNTSGDGPARSGLVVNSGVVEIQNSIVAGNGITNNFAISTSATLTSLGYNLTSSSDVFTATGDITSTQPLLEPLRNNGGSTPTHALVSGGAGVDAANPAGCTGADGAPLTRDQRGFPRPVNGHGDVDTAPRCDIGAYELWVPAQSLYLPIAPNAGPPVTAPAGAQ